MGNNFNPQRGKISGTPDPVEPSSRYGGSGSGGGALPRYLTTFVGRLNELARLHMLLTSEDIRLITLTGLGGSGKTRLAVRAGSEAAKNFDERVWFVSLASVRDPMLMIPAIAQTIGVRQVAGDHVDSALVRLLQDKCALLIVDNFETVSRAGPQIASLLLGCPLLKIIVTSREVLRISGEHVFVVPPLALPSSAQLLPVEQLRRVESVQLFIDRSNASGSGFELTPQNASTIIDICSRLDGLPLALELAAARSATFSPFELLERLHRPLSVLTAGPLDAPERHRSMRAAIAWSHDLLTDDEQVAFRQLSVFLGGFTMDAEDSVVHHSGDIFEMLSSFVSKSLLIPVAGNGPFTRFYMLETLREYGMECLEACGDIESTRDRHAEWYMALAERGEWAWCMPLEEGLDRLGRLEADHGNLRAALRWRYQCGKFTTCLRMAASLGSFWVVGGHCEEGRIWLERLLAVDQQYDESSHAMALATLSWISIEMGHASKAFPLAERGLEMSRRNGAALGIALCLVLSGVAAKNLGDYDLAVSRQQEAIALLDYMEETTWTYLWVNTLRIELGAIAFMRGDIEGAQKWLKEALDEQVERGYAPGMSHVYGSQVLLFLADVYRAQGLNSPALSYYMDHLRIAWQHFHSHVCIHVIGGIAGSLACLGHLETAARLFGASEALHESLGYPFDSETFDLQRAFGLPEPWARESESFGVAQAIRDALGPRSMNIRTIPNPGRIFEAWNAGRTLSFSQAIAEALAVTTQPHMPPGLDVTRGLTRREVQVLALIAEGKSNRAIAASLSISERTVENHVMHILTKLGVESRSAAAAYAIRHDLA